MGYLTCSTPIYGYLNGDVLFLETLDFLGGYMDFGELNFADFASFFVVVLKVVDLGVWLGMTFLVRENA